MSSSFYIKSALKDWLSRDTGSRGVSSFNEFAAILATDQGLRRAENQDRVAAMHFVAISATSPSFVAFALADGMGGMQSGAECAEIAISSFFSSLCATANIDISIALEEAIRSANADVFEFSKGRGGSTLSAVIIHSSGSAHQAHVGDSRVYEFERGVGGELLRTTVDDSLKEVVGGHGRDLLQFIGMGEGIKPHIKTLSAALNIMLSSDGVHFLSQDLIESIIVNCPNVRSIAERLLALARWAGSPDNASLILLNPVEVRSKLASHHSSSLKVWDAFGELNIAVLPASSETIDPRTSIDVKEKPDGRIRRVAKGGEVGKVEMTTKYDDSKAYKRKKTRVLKLPKAADAGARAVAFQNDRLQVEVGSAVVEPGPKKVPASEEP